MRPTAVRPGNRVDRQMLVELVVAGALGLAVVVAALVVVAVAVVEDEALV